MFINRNNASYSILEEKVVALGKNTVSAFRHLIFGRLNAVNINLTGH